MGFSLRFTFNLIIALIWIKLLFSYLSVKLSYFQRHLTPNVEKFNPLGLPENFSKNIEFILLPVLLWSVIKHFKRFDKWMKEIIIISFIMFFLNIITGIINQKAIIESLNYTFKLFVPIYLFCFLIMYNKTTYFEIKKVVFRTIYLCVILTIIAIIFFNPSFNRLRNYLPIYFDGIHTHSYVLVSIFIGLSFKLYVLKKYYTMVIFFFLSILFMYFGYNVRTPLLMYLLYAITMVYLVPDIIFKALILRFLIFAPLILLFIILSLDLNELSSGRIDMYIEKANQLFEFGFIDWLFGKGAGSDLIASDVWWWEKKGAHSDLITYLVENGIVYLLFFALLFLRLTLIKKKANIIYMSILIGGLITSTISNGIFSRPIAAYLFFIVLAYIYIENKNHKQLII